MLIASLAGIVTAGLAALTFAYPSWKPEDARRRKVVRPGDDVQKAIDRAGAPIFMTDRRLYIIGLALTILAALLLTIGVVL